MKKLFSLISSFFFFATPVNSQQYGPLNFSKEGYDLIVYFETGGRVYYEKNLKKISWPGGASGATGGIGYDFGYNTRQQIAEDWGFLGPKTVALLQSAAGQKGSAGKLAAQRLKLVSISWESAEKVFQKSSMPRFANYTYKTFPKIDETHPHVQSSITSIVFNRGPSLRGSGRVEMRNIKQDILNSDIKSIPREIRSMKRLWVGKGLNGLLVRREAEAKLIEKTFK
jgi:hypothetical protein